MIVFPLFDLDVPSGGARIIYGMVDTLNRHGIEAAVWHGEEGFQLSWFPHQTKVVHGLERTLEPGDLLVFPEIGGRRYRPLMGDARVVILNQNHFYTLDGADWSTPVDEPYPGLPGVVAVVATSETILDYVKAVCAPSLPIHHIPVFIDDEMFVSRPKSREIAFMLVRRPREITLVMQALTRQGLLPEGWRFRVIDGVPPSEVARALGGAAVFATFASIDGFSLPGAEALAAGCHVVGFHGGGGRDYMMPEFTTPVDDPDFLAFAHALAAAAREFDEDPEAFAARADKGREFVRARYTTARFEAATVEVFRNLIAQGAGQEDRVVVRHFNDVARPLPPARRLLAAVRRWRRR